MTIKVTAIGDGSFVVTCGGETAVVYAGPASIPIDPFVFPGMEDPTGPKRRTRPGPRGPRPQALVVIGGPRIKDEPNTQDPQLELHELLGSARVVPTYRTMLLDRDTGLRAGAPMHVNAHVAVGNTYDLGKVYRRLGLYEPELDHPILLQIQADDPSV